MWLSSVNSRSAGESAGPYWSIKALAETIGPLYKVSRSPAYQPRLVHVVVLGSKSSRVEPARPLEAQAWNYHSNLIPSAFYGSSKSQGLPGFKG